MDFRLSNTRRTASEVTKFADRPSLRPPGIPAIVRTATDHTPREGGVNAIRRCNLVSDFWFKLPTSCSSVHVASASRSRALTDSS